MKLSMESFALYYTFIDCDYKSKVFVSENHNCDFCQNYRKPLFAILYLGHLHTGNIVLEGNVCR